MPVEIKELVIRVTVSGEPPRDTRTAQGGHEQQGAHKDEIVAECVEQVFQLLQAKKER
jgi:hypothetical protein